MVTLFFARVSVSILLISHLGIHGFLVPIRDKELNVVPGVTIHDMGHKMGLNGVDNAKFTFDNVHVPRENLLNKFWTFQPFTLITNVACIAYKKECCWWFYSFLNLWNMFSHFPKFVRSRKYSQCEHFIYKATLASHLKRVTQALLINVSKDAVIPS